MNAETKKISKLIAIAEDLGWRIHESSYESYYSGKDEQCFDFHRYSDLGEDFGFCIYAETAEEFVDEVSSYYEFFDPEDHASTWYNARDTVSGVPKSLRALLDDADKIDEYLGELARTLKNYFEEELV